MNDSQKIFSGKVLVVDDDFAIRLIASETLEQAGFEVKAVDNGQDALSQFTVFNPDIIVLDLLMPGMDGFHTCTEIRSLPDGTDVPILILTGLDDLESVTSAFRLGATDFVTKPIQWSVLPYRIHNLIQSYTAKLERKQALAALLEREQRLDFLLTNSPAVIYTCKCSGDFGTTFVSRNVCQLLGYSENDFLSESAFWADHIHPDDAERVFSDLMSLTTHGNHSHEYRFRHKDGTYRWMRDECLVLYDVDGKPKELIGFWLDIGNRKLAEEKLNESERKYQTLFESMTDGYAYVDMGGRITEFNKAYCSMIGYTAEEVGLLTYEDITPVQWHAFEREIIEKQVMARGYSDLYEKEYHCKNGSILPIELRTYLSRDQDGIPIGMWAIIRDISESKHAADERESLQKQLLHAQKLESLGVLAGGVAHDFNNILTAIIGNTELALIKLKPESPVINNLHNIEQAANRAANLAKQMLAYSGKGKFVIESLDINCLLEEMVHMLEVSISKNVELRLNLTPNIPAFEADSTQIHQVIMNLVINASEAIGDNSGIISINTGFMNCDKIYLEGFWMTESISAGEYVYLEISDTGCGMDKETMSRLFDPFFTTKFTGRGLGMSAVLGIIRGHKGAIKVDSRPGKGTTFRVFLPASGKPCKTSINDIPLDKWRGEGKVLLVDDEETVRNIGKEMLQKLGLSVITANDGKDALKVFMVTPDIAFIILDLTMPHMNGEQCFRELKLLEPDVKVIISSGFSEFEVSEKFLGKGMAGFIQKPYKLSALIEAIRNIA